MRTRIRVSLVSIETFSQTIARYRKLASAPELPDKDCPAYLGAGPGSGCKEVPCPSQVDLHSKNKPDDKY